MPVHEQTIKLLTYECDKCGVVVDTSDDQSEDGLLDDWFTCKRLGAITAICPTCQPKCAGVNHKSPGDRCLKSVSYIDKRGFVYCDAHGLQRKQHEPCRKLTKSEIGQLFITGMIDKY
jgi:hypothetical protein